MERYDSSEFRINGDEEGWKPIREFSIDEYIREEEDGGALSFRYSFDVMRLNKLESLKKEFKANYNIYPNAAFLQIESFAGMLTSLGMEMKDEDGDHYIMDMLVSIVDSPSDEGVGFVMRVGV